jgi:hypothetical protein
MYPGSGGAGARHKLRELRRASLTGQTNAIGLMRAGEWRRRGRRLGHGEPLAHTAAAACRLPPNACPDETPVPVWIHRERVLRRAGSAGNADMP